MRTNLVLFSYAGNFLKAQSVRVGVINNIWLFVPLGTGLYRIFQKKWVLLIPFVMSVAIELTQYITGLGIAEFDDVFGNTMGGWIGVLVAWTWVKRLALGSDPCAQQRALHRAGGNPARKENNHLIR